MNIDHFLSPDGHIVGLSNRLFAKSRQRAIENICQIFQTSFQIPALTSNAWLEKAARFIKNYQSDKSVEKPLRAFDCALKTKLGHFSHEVNLKKHEKITHYPQLKNIPKAMLENILGSPELSSTESLDLIARLFSQMKITRDDVILKYDQLWIKYEGSWITLKTFVETFKLFDSKIYDYLLLRHKTTGHIYTYLDNGKGLEIHNPFDAPHPICHLEDSDLDKIHKQASLYYPNQTITQASHPYILQIVSSRTKDKNQKETAQHTYLRLIALEDLNNDFGIRIKKGDVFSFSFYPKKVPCKHMYSFLHVVDAEIRSSEPWDYITSDDRYKTTRYVTNVPIAPKNAQDFIKFIAEKHQGYDTFTPQFLKPCNFDPETGAPKLRAHYNFQIIGQNCTVLMQEAAEAAGVTVKTEMSLGTAAYRYLTPDCVKKWISSHMDERSTLADRANHPTASTTRIRRVVLCAKAALQFIVDMLSIPLVFLFRHFLGQAKGFPNQSIDPIILHLPEVVQDWQISQPSTIIYDMSQTRLAIVPPEPG